MTTSSVSLPPYNSFTMTLSGANTIETYKFYALGDGVTAGTGTLKAQWVLTYTDNTRATLVSGVFTDLT